MKPSVTAPVATVDEQHPWLGLVSFTEETRGFFHGREEEAAELGRRVQRKLLTILFGQSGLGKTSILQAGLVPRLRPEGFCPVYVRLDYDPNSPPPAEQIKRAVFRATEAAGTWTQSGTAVAGETLWEFLHHRDDVLKDADGRTLIPILIFDQFEEIFTLAQSDDAGRRRAQEFLADLADLVENRPPVALEARIDRDEADAAKFDFARADYRILISLREDYLAHLEGLKVQMPSVTQNRMRLARMTGVQAIAAVCRPAAHLVTETVAAAIVRFVAGGAELAHAEVEPSLLSLICRELNNARLTRGQAEISADLLEGSRDTILSEFYERALSDQPSGVRIFIEDEMLTESGFRESIAEERLRKGFAAAGAKPEALAALVDRRLLRVEDRLDMRRVEITHDVLCSVIGASRRVRHEREALEESKRQLAAQEEREAATQRALVRARWVAAVASGLMLLAIGSAIFGWLNYRRASAAEVEAAQSRTLAEKARSESEKLIAFLLEDFYEELAPTGRVEIVAKLADKAVAYYDGLPRELLTPETRLYRSMALIRKANALAESGEVAEAAKVADAAKAIVEQLRTEQGDNDELTTALALTISSRVSGTNFILQQDALKAAVALLRPLVASGRASRAAKLELADMLGMLPHLQPREEALITCEESRKILEDLGAVNLSDLTAASAYGDATDTQARIAYRLGRLDESERLAKIVGDISEKVLERRPGDLRAMVDRFYAANDLGTVAEARHQFAEAEAHYAQEMEAAKNYALFNPADTLAWRDWNESNLDLGRLYEKQGRIPEALRQYRIATEREHDPRNKIGIDINSFDAWAAIARLEAEHGNLPAAHSALAEHRRTGELILKQRDINPELSEITKLGFQVQEFDILAAEGNYASIQSKAAEVAEEIGKIKETSESNRSFRESLIRNNRRWLIESALRTGHTEAGVTVAREAVANPLLSRTDKFAAEAAIARNKVRLGEALLAADQRSEALATLGEAVTYYRNERATGSVETNFLQDYARAVYQLARAQSNDYAGGTQRRVLLDEATNAIGGLAFDAQQLRVSRELIKWISDARKQTGR